MLTEMLEIVLTPKIFGPPKSGALGLSLFSLMLNPRLCQIKIDPASFCLGDARISVISTFNQVILALKPRPAKKITKRTYKTNVLTKVP